MSAAAPLEPPSPGHPPSDGAHRLCWWLAEQPRWRAVWLRGRLGGTLLDRLLIGEVEPSDEVAATVARETDGAVRDDDWRRGGPLGWRDRPYKRED